MSAEPAPRISFDSLDAIGAPAGFVDRTGCVLHLNPAFADLLGLDAGPHVGVPLQRLLRPNAPDAVQRRLGAALARGGHAVNVDTQRPDGTFQRLQLLFRALPQEDRVYVLVLDRTPQGGRRDRWIRPIRAP